jgi:uncharacterized membrane protein (UPF0127 family)
VIGVVVVVVGIVGAVVIAGSGGDGSSSGRTALPGFGDIAYRVEHDGRTATVGCALLAATEAQQNRGLMNVRDLKGYDGMVFQFASDTTVGFYMKDTPMPLSIAWFDGRGQFVSSADMAPARETPTYYAAAPYRYAFEVPQGKLGPAGIGAGSTLVLGGRC